MAIVACDYCGKEFFKSPCYIKRSKSNFCSHECHNKKNAKIEFICTVCGTTFLKRPSEAKKSLNLFCSRECKSISIKDKKDSRKKRKEPIWKGDYLKTYHRWRMMIQRCTNSKNTAYYNYGGRGITVCKRLLVYNNFLDDMGYPPKETTLDRLDNKAKSRYRNRKNKRWRMITRILEQGSDEWLEYRKNHIGSSDSGAILGLSKYKSSYGVWLDKKGLSFDTPPNYNMLMGTASEPGIRKHYEEISGKKFEPLCIEHSEFPFLAASTDGMSADGDVIEIKHSLYKKLSDCIKKNDIEHLKELYPTYNSQIQHILMCSGKDKCELITEWEGEIISMTVERDSEFIEQKMLPELIVWWNTHIVKDIQPDLPEDAAIFIDEPDVDAEELLLKIDLALEKQVKERIKMRKDKIFSYGDDGNFYTKHFKYTRISRQTVNYKQACEDAGIDVNPYMKSGIGYYKLTGIK